WAKPLDEKILHRVGSKFGKVVTVEDGVVGGGVGSAVLEWFADHGYNPMVVRLGIGDEFVEHGTVPELKSLCGYDAEGIFRALVE
ncbi:MAG: 1-deoxy-D-xylulose-5-phosphate synthase, partial [Tidjanibacter sp.]|nr:1-deoxy-D-xylulose-5-phosphate synthase [Tidjanibacter sp.]